MNKEKSFAVKEDLVAMYAEKAGVTAKKAREVVNDVIDTIVDSLCDKNCDGIMFRNLFTIEKVVRSGRKGVVPMNGVAFNSPSTLQLKISAGKVIFDRLNSGK